jgi:hypothetical protein
MRMRRYAISPGSASGVPTLTSNQVAGAAPLGLVLSSGDIGENRVRICGEVGVEETVEGTLAR